VLIAEDEDVVREALAELVGSDPQLEVAATARDAAEAVELAAHGRPDVALLDVKMPGGGGVHAAEELRKLHPGLPVIAFSAYQDRTTVLDMLRAGAVGYVVKGAPPEEILQAIHRAVRGEGSLSVEVTADVIHELTQLLQRSEALGRELAELNRTKSELMQVLAHELFTPITSIQGFALTLAERGTSLSQDDVRALAEGVTRATERLQRLVGNVRTAAALDREDVRAATRPTPVRDIVDRTRMEFSSLLGRLVFPEDDGALSVRVWAEPDLAVRAVVTVVENGLAFGPDDTPVEIGVRLGDGRVDLAISDRGPGIPEEVRHRIFDPFTQLDPSATRAHEGLGVGLFLARRVMLAHGGDVRAEERPGGGARVILSFPSVVETPA
jgi:signal transduction histidine kinase